MQTLREVLLTPTHRGVQLVRCCETGDDSLALALPIGAAVRSGHSHDDGASSRDGELSSPVLLPSQIHVRGRVDYHTTLWVAHTFVFDAACADARVLYSVPRTRMAAPPCYTPGTLYPPHAVVQHHDTVYENSSSCDVHAAPGQTMAWVRWGSVEELTQRVPPPLSCTRALAFVGSAYRSDADMAPAAATAPRGQDSSAAMDCALVHDHDEEGYCCRVGDVPAHTTVHVLWELRGVTPHGHVAVLAPAMCQRPCELHVHLTSAAPPVTTVPVDARAISEALILPRIQANHAVLWWSSPLGRYQAGSARGSVEVPAVEAQIGEALWGTARIVAPQPYQSHDHHYWSWHCTGPAHVKTEIHVKAALHRPYLTQHLQLPSPLNVTIGHVHTPAAAARFTVQHGHVLASSQPITLITRQHKASEWFSYAACTETFAVPGVRGPLTLWIVHYTGDTMPVLSWRSETSSDAAAADVADEEWETPILTTRPSWKQLRVACARHAQHVQRMGSELLREGGGARALLMLVANDTTPGDEPWHALATQMIMEWRLSMHAVRSANAPLLHQILQLLAHMTGIPHDRDQYPVRASAFPVMDLIHRPPAYHFDVPPPYRGILAPKVAHTTPYGTCSLRELRKRKSTQHMGPYAQEMRTALTQLLIETDADIKMEHTMEDQLRAQLHETYASADNNVA